MRFFDITLHVGWKEEPLLFELLGGLHNFLHIALVILVALFERSTRIAGCLALGPGSREGDMLTIRFASIRSAKLERPMRPSGRGGDRRRDRRQADASRFVAVSIHLRHKDRIGGTSGERRRVVRNDAIAEIRPEVEQISSRDHPGIGHTGYRRPAQFFLRHDAGLRTGHGYRSRRAIGAPRHLALRRIGPVAHPLVKRDQERTMCGIGADCVGKLLAHFTVGAIPDDVRQTGHQVKAHVFRIL